MLTQCSSAYRSTTDSIGGLSFFRGLRSEVEAFVLGVGGFSTGCPSLGTDRVSLEFMIDYKFLEN